MQVRVLPGSLIPKPYIGCAYMLTANPVATHTAKQMLIQKCGRLSHRRENGGGSQSCATQYNGACPPPSLLAAAPGQLEAWHYEVDFVGCANPQNIMCRRLIRWPVGLMDKASASGAGDSRFESWAGHFFLFRHKMHGCPRSIQVHLNSCSTNLWLGLGSPSMRMFVWSGQSCLPVHD